MLKRNAGCAEVGHSVICMHSSDVNMAGRFAVGVAMHFCIGLGASHSILPLLLGLLLPEQDLPRLPGADVESCTNAWLTHAGEYDCVSKVPGHVLTVASRDDPIFATATTLSKGSLGSQQHHWAGSL